MVESVSFKGANHLMISGYPTTQEMIVGKALLADSKEDFETMMLEFHRVGLNIDSFARHCLYGHPYNEACTNFAQLENVSWTFKRAIVVGAGASTFLFDRGLNEVLGVVMSSKWMPGVKLVTLPRVSMIRGGGVGEYRLALEKYAAL
jgi:hypothetical protein